MMICVAVHAASEAITTMMDLRVEDLVIPPSAQFRQSSIRTEPCATSVATGQSSRIMVLLLQTAPGCRQLPSSLAVRVYQPQHQLHPPEQSCAIMIRLFATRTEISIEDLR